MQQKAQATCTTPTIRRGEHRRESQPSASSSALPARSKRSLGWDHVVGLQAITAIATCDEKKSGCGWCGTVGGSCSASGCHSRHWRDSTSRRSMRQPRSWFELRPRCLPRLHTCSQPSFSRALIIIGTAADTTHESHPAPSRCPPSPGDRPAAVICPELSRYQRRIPPVPYRFPYYTVLRKQHTARQPRSGSGAVPGPGPSRDPAAVGPGWRRAAEQRHV